MLNLQAGVLYGQALTILLYRKPLSDFVAGQVAVLLRFAEEKQKSLISQASLSLLCASLETLY
ncbi:hypothetical protein M3194_14035 [Paenibacillus glycanilyticus]|uniref:hypothetical protein n=1 Tax=Paenibacillus glycanilyticus TaxID=126569 RepID=UPI00203DAC01|nr:hypothetical protein [Paenibacillus glycanilyticus]MCM3628481.1 hypothetical protein [Paenibacillus glycanilyticus]